MVYRFPRPSHSRFGDLAYWGHDPFPAPSVILHTDMFHCLLECAAFSDLPRFRSGSHRSRVSSAAVAVPDTCVGEVAAPIDLDWGQVRVWQPERHFWKTPGRLPTVWQVEKTRRANRENVGPSVPRGRRDSHPQCQIVGHERASPGN